DEWALAEELLTGLDFTDLLPAYQDQIHWYSIKLLLKDRSEVPVFAAGEYEPREFLMNWYYDIQARLLRALGALLDVGQYSRDVLDRFLHELRSAGIEAPLR